MTRCQRTDGCPFFTDEVGYSTELQEEMRRTYCMGDNSGCARLHALDILPLTSIPDDLIPTEHDRLAELAAAFEREICERCLAKDPGCC